MTKPESKDHRQVKACHQKKRFKLPQQYEVVQADFCNESVRLEDPTRGFQGDNAEAQSSAKSSFGKFEFDVWPGSLQKSKTERTKEWLEEMNNGDYNYWRYTYYG